MASKKRETMRGFGDPDTHVGEVVEIPSGTRTSKVPTEGIELEYVHEAGTPALLTGPWRAIEIWTQNRIYGCDSTLTLRHVLDRATGSVDADHPALGARLLGGQVRDDEGKIVSVSHPLPGRGAAAFFASRRGKRLIVSETSAVTRVIFRQRIVAVSDTVPDWEDVTGDG